MQVFHYLIFINLKKKECADLGWSSYDFNTMQMQCQTIPIECYPSMRAKLKPTQILLV